MIREFDAGGLFFAPLVASAVVALVLWFPLRSGLSRAGLYRWVWHPALFDIALFVLLFAAVTARATFPEI
jgi:hypothetical protein